MGAISTNGDRQPFVTIIAIFLDFTKNVLYIFLAQALRRHSSDREARGVKPPALPRRVKKPVKGK